MGFDRCTTLAVWGSGVRVPSAPPVFLGVVAVWRSAPTHVGPNVGPKSVYGTSVEGAQKASRRSRGTVRKHRSGYQVRVSAGTDPVTGELLRLQGTAPTM